MLSIKSDQGQIISIYCSDGVDPKDVRICSSCKKWGRKMRKCGGCGQRSYCDEECQRRDWKSGHRQDCKRLPPNSKLPKNSLFK